MTYRAENIHTLKDLGNYCQEYLDAFDEWPPDYNEIIRSHNWVAPIDNDNDCIAGDPSTFAAVSFDPYGDDIETTTYANASLFYSLYRHPIGQNQ